MLSIAFHAGKAVKLSCIGIEHFHILSGRGLEAIIGKRVYRIEIQGKDKVFAPKYQDFLLLVCPKQERARTQYAVTFDKMNHFRIEGLKAAISEEAVVSKGPKSPGMLETPPIAGSGEVYPFRMAELIAHEIEVPVPGSADSSQPDQFV